MLRVRSCATMWGLLFNYKGSKAPDRAQVSACAPAYLDKGDITHLRIVSEGGKNMKNKELKIKLFENGDYLKYREILRYNYMLYQKYYNNFIDHDTFDSFYVEPVSFFSYDETRALDQLYQSRKKRVSRTRKIIEYLLQKDCLFLTLTFVDKVLYSTLPVTRRKYVRIYLESLGVDFIARKDFGKKNGREHYHAIVQTDFIDSKFYIYGALNFKRCIRNNSAAISKYLNKLTLHSLKDTACGRSLLSKGLSKKIS